MMRRRPRRGTKLVSQMAAPQSRTRLACAQTAHISPIFVIPTATNSSGLLDRLPDLELRRTAFRRAVLAQTPKPPSYPRSPAGIDPKPSPAPPYGFVGPS